MDRIVARQMTRRISLIREISIKVPRASSLVCYIFILQSLSPSQRLSNSQSGLEFSVISNSILAQKAH